MRSLLLDREPTSSKNTLPRRPLPSHRSRHSITSTSTATSSATADPDPAAMALATRPRSALGFLSHRPFSSRSGRRDHDHGADDDDLALVPRKYAHRDGDDKKDDSLNLLSPTTQPRTLPLRRRASSSTVSLSPSSSPKVPQSPSYTHSPDPSPQHITASRAAEWVTGDLDDDAAADPAKAAYERAKRTLATELGPADSKWLDETNTMDDVEGAMRRALDAWLAKGKESKAVHWLRACSQRILHYGSIFEIVADKCPEYVSLAYGAFKFLFIVVIQHEELCTEIAKAVARIAHVLPRMSLHTDLYRTEHMQGAIAAVYAKIVEFSVLAIRWYKKGRFLQSLQAIAKPWDIGYKGIVDEIIELSRQVDEVASAASQAEIRMLTTKNERLHGKVDLLEGKIDRLTEVLISEQSLNRQILIDLREYKTTFRQEQIYDIREAFLLPSDPIPDTSLTYVRSLRNRRRQKTPTTLPPAQLRKLKDFMASPTSQLLLAQGNGIRTSSLDFAADFLDIVVECGVEVLWALPDKAPVVKSPSRYRDESEDENEDDYEDKYGGCERGEQEGRTTVMGILRSMVLQAMSLEAGILSDGQYPITKRHLRAADTVKKWFLLLQRCILSFRRLLVVIDLSIIEAAVANTPPSSTYDDDDPFTVEDFVHELESMLERLPRKQAPLVKVVTVSWRFGAVQRLTRDGEVFEDDRNRVYTDRGARQERLARRPKYRAVAKRRGERMPDRFREIVGGFEEKKADEGGRDDGISEESESEDDDFCGRKGSWN